MKIAMWTVMSLVCDGCIAQRGEPRVARFRCDGDGDVTFTTKLTLVCDHNIVSVVQISDDGSRLRLMKTPNPCPPVTPPAIPGPEPLSAFCQPGRSVGAPRRP
jgi:hypothetical protein